MAARTGARRLAPRSPKKMSPWPSLGSPSGARESWYLYSRVARLRRQPFLDDRAFFANSTHAAVYVVLHATSTGHGVRVYTSMLPYSNGDDRGPFRSWPTAQASFIPLSHIAAASVAEALKKDEITVRDLTAPLRPLNNIVTAAIAVEVAPPAANVSALTAPDYQQLIAGAVANGIAAVRPQLGAAP